MENILGIKKENRAQVVQSLAKLLADEFILYTKTRNAHWNVEGPDFHSMHVFFEKQFEQLDEIIDQVAERIRTLGHFAPASLSSFLSLTHLTEKMENKNSAKAFIHALLTDHEQIIAFIRTQINPFVNEFGDAGSSDFITALLEQHETMAWMLRAHVN